jgi:hypothetical protein
MGLVSIILNLFTIGLVAIVFYITFLAFNKRKVRNETWLETFKRVWSSDKEINKALKGPKYGDLGSFVGQDWQYVASIPIKEADSQDSLLDFIAEGTPNIVGTGGPTT